MTPDVLDVLDVLDVRAASDSALQFSVARDRGEVATARVRALFDALHRAPPPWLRDVVPAWTTVLVEFDPLAVHTAAVEAYVRSLLSTSVPSSSSSPGGPREHVLAASFLPEHAPDLDDVAARVGGSARLIELLLGAPHTVAFLGFRPGFAYLHAPAGLDDVTRRAAAVPIAAGSIAVAAGQLGVYPAASPGGWRVVGRVVDLEPLRPLAAAPWALPGDRVRFTLATSSAGGSRV